METPFRPGSVVIVYLRDPRERVCGILATLGTEGVAIRGLDLASFDDWLRGIGQDEAGCIVTSPLFYPMGRVERILGDEDAPGVPGLDTRCRERTGRSMAENVFAEAAAAARGRCA